MVDLSYFAELLALDHGLCVLSTLRTDASIQASVVNAGVLRHPVTHVQIVGLVARGNARKLQNLRVNPRSAIVVRAGWQWATVEGDAEILGPNDPHPDIDGEALRVLLQDIYRAAGGTHDDWSVFDHVMAAEQRAAVLIHPRRSYTNP